MQCLQRLIILHTNYKWSWGLGGGAVGVQSLLTEDAGFLKAGPDYTTVHSECRSIAA